MKALFLDWGLPADEHHYADVVEICGEEERTTHLLIRRLHREGFQRGPACDVRCGVDLTRDFDLQWIWQHASLRPAPG